MWENGVLGTDLPWALVCAAFFVVGLHISLEGGQEHRQLTIGQFNCVPSDGSYSKDSYYKYVEHGSKNYQGKFAEIDSNNVTCAYAQPRLMHCPVMIIDLYISKLPLQPKAFYMQPLSKVPDDLA